MTTKLDAEEVKALEAAAATMAAMLLEREGVTAIHLYDVPPPRDPQSSFEYRLLVIVSDEMFARCESRVLNPPLIGREDRDDHGNTWTDEYTPETKLEALFGTLGTTPETFFERVYLKTSDAFGVDAENTVSVILAPENWTTQAATQLERCYTSLDQTFHLPILPNGEGHYALCSYRIFDPATGTFGPMAT